MKKNLLHFAYVGAIALVGSVCFSACSDDKNDPGSGSNTNEVNKASEVNVNFVFNVSANSQANTRMTASAVQENNNFRGMIDAHLFSYAVPTPGEWVTTPGAAGTMKKYFDLGAVVSSNDVNHIDNEAGGGKSNRILTISLPTGVNSLMFYGRAARSTTSANPNVDFGSVNYNVDITNPANNVFSYQQRLVNEPKHIESMWSLANMLTELVNVKINPTEDDAWFWWCPNEVTYSGVKTKIMPATADDKTTYTGPIDTKVKLFGTLSPQNFPNGYKELEGGYCYLVHYGLTWRQTGYDELANTDPGITDEPQSVMGESLGEAYYRLTTLTVLNPGLATETTELRGGSGDAVLKTVQDVYGIIRHATDSKPNTASEAVAYKLANRIKTCIEKYFTADGYTLTYKTSDTFEGTAKTFVDAVIAASDNVTVKDDVEDIIKYKTRNSFTLTSSDALNTFPTNYGLPEGSALLTFKYNDGTTLAQTMTGDNRYYGGTFTYQRTLPSYDIGVAAGVHVTDYVYPAELLYFGNSPIRTTNNILETSQFPNGSADWLDDAKWEDQNGAGWSAAGSVVSSTTRSVAMAQNINYGVALLKTRVDVAPTIVDNRAALVPGETNKVIDPTNFELTGIIVGSQPNKVGWNFTSATAPTPAVTWTSMIYDTKFDDGMGAIPTPAGYNYTLTFDNYVHTSDVITDNTQNDVYVALEFKNKGDNFYAMHNLVRNGGTFYIVGKLRALAPASFSTFTNWPKSGTKYTYAMPPYKDGDEILEVPRVLMQDYTTTANFTIGQYSLQKAYVTVPDLRSSQVSLGLSVDVKWETGLTFDVTLGDTN